jgi:GT2 family glycosyltransferase
VSVIVLNLNGRRFLDDCLGPLLSQELEGGFEVILADNGSSDGSAEHVRDRYPGVRVLEMGSNLGFSSGNNRAMRAALGADLVLLNNDTRVQPGWLRALTETASSDAKVGAVTSKLVFADRPKVLQNTGLLLLSDGAGGDRGTGEVDRGQYDRREEVFGFCGAAAFLRREALEDAGMFDETFFAYYEDTDLSWRLRLRGWKILFEPAAVVWHVHSATSREGSALFTFHADRNRLFTVVKDARARFVARSLWAAGRRALGSGRRGGTGAPGAPRQLRRVLVSFLLHLPEMMGKRLAVRLRRRVPDGEIERWVYPREEWDARCS